MVLAACQARSGANRCSAVLVPMNSWSDQAASSLDVAPERKVAFDGDHEAPVIRPTGRITLRR